MIETPLYMQEGAYSSRQDRLVFDVLFTEGIIDPGSGEWLVTERAAGPNMSIDVAPGRAVIDGDDQANQGAYFVRSTGVENVVISPADLVNPRIDLVVLRVRDSNVIGGANDDAIVDVIEGVPAAVPAAPALPASAIPLASIAVPVGMVDVEDADVSDLRAPSSNREFTVVSGWLKVTTAERDALAPDPGDVVYNLTTSLVETWNGAEWIPLPEQVPTPVNGLDTLAATTTVVNTAAETTIYTKDLPTDLEPGDVLRLTLLGDFLNNTGASQSMRLKVKLGATTMVDSTAGTTIGSNANRRDFRFDALLTIISTVSESLDLDARIGQINALWTTSAIYSMMDRGLAAEDVAAAPKALAVTWQHGVANALLDLRIHSAILEKVAAA